MKKLILIAADEWRYWYRSRLALWSILSFIALLIFVSALNILKISEENHARSHYQKNAEETFLSQPDRHPHRMVHYGHYAFRTPSPLAFIDPGLDSVTGQSIFLEGHRQNSATFDDSTASADLGGLSWLPPALVYQWYAPLLLILLGYGSIVRERESSTLDGMLAQSLQGGVLLAGKILALLSIASLLLLPMLIAAIIVEGISISLVLTLSYLAYFMIWVLVIVLISALLRSRASILSSLVAVWLCFCLLIPSVAVDIESQASTYKNKLESDLRMFAELRKLGDGHNANDPAFANIRANLLAQYDVKKIEDLPINLRGIVAKYSEEKLTKVLNQYSKNLMTSELEQANALNAYGWLSPALTISSASRAIAGTDLYHYHQFLQQAESLRYDFVQGLNSLQAEQITYKDDMNRSRDTKAEKRTRVSSKNWQLLNGFEFQPASLATRIQNAKLSLIKMLLWLIGLTITAFIAGKVLRP